MKSLNVDGQLLSLETPIVMGILNVTPDSFFDGGYFENEENILFQTKKMLEEGASIIDIGGYSTRPDADDIPIEEEVKRVTNAIRLVLAEFPETIISIDTFRSKVAEESILAGAKIINDVSGGNLDANMFNTVVNLQVPYIMMHSKGNPQTMKTLNQYENMFSEMLDYFNLKVNILLEKGCKDIVIDPGFGFAKNIEQNFELLQNLNLFHTFNLPLLVGISRKSMIYKTLKIEPKEALNGTTVLHTLALQQGASILRVHDVKEAIQTIHLLEKSKQLPISLSLV